MEANIEEALRAKANAERQFAERDFVGARNYASKAQMLFPELEGISQLVATLGVYIASEAKVNGEFDFYSILGIDPSADRSKVKKQYKKMAVLLHPDKNKSVGADGAFRLVSEAWTVLSDSAKRSSYDQRRNMSTGHRVGVVSYDNYSKFSSSHSRLDTFWTVCTSCHVQYEYLRKYVNKRLSCKNCRGVFVAVETGVAPVNGSFPYSPWSYAPENGYASHGSGTSYIPKSTAYSAANGVSGHHTGHGSEYVSNISFQWNSCPGNSSGHVDSNVISSFVTDQGNAKTNRVKARGKHHMVNGGVNVAGNGFATYGEVPGPKRGRPAKKRKVEESTCPVVHEMSAKAATEAKTACANGNLKQSMKLSSPFEASIRRSAAPAFDARQFLLDKARRELRRKLEEIRLTEAAEAEMRKANADSSSKAAKISDPNGGGNKSEQKNDVPLSIIVPDSDFHDFDKDRSEECFKPKQIWALYDEEDGMPRLYCLIREVISAKPFKIHISYLSSKTDSEFGPVNWLYSGFTKSCGNFRAFNSEVVEQVNIFSHLLSKEKAGRGGCVRIYPRSGDIWAIYRNWSPHWNRTTPAKERHQYEMVEVLDDYSEELGVCVAPLIKLDGFKTVYQRNTNREAIRWIPRREMVRFSHQVPSCLLKADGTNLPEGCWDLDPAATPDEFLREESKVGESVSCGQVEKFVGTLNKGVEHVWEVEEKLIGMEDLTASLTEPPIFMTEEVKGAAEHTEEENLMKFPSDCGSQYAEKSMVD